MELDQYYVEHRAKLMARSDIKKYATLREYLTKGGDRDIDATGEVYDFLCAICCEPITITDEGEKRWGKVLDCPILVCNDAAWGIILDAEIVDEDNPDDYFIDEFNITEHFLLALAGECLETDYDKWFKITESED